MHAKYKSILVKLGNTRSISNHATWTRTTTWKLGKKKKTRYKLKRVDGKRCLQGHFFFLWNGTTKKKKKEISLPPLATETILELGWFPWNAAASAGGFSFIHSFIHSFIRSFIRSFMERFVPRSRASWRPALPSLLGYTGFYWVILGFTQFYRVILSFTKFNRVLPGFT